MEIIKKYVSALAKKANFIALGCFIVLSGSVIFGWASLKKSSLKKEVKKAPVEQTYAPAKADPAKIKMLSEVCRKMSLNRDEFFIEGIINANNGADSADRLDAATYVFSKKGNSFYYKLGAVETINREDLSIYIDHGIKKIMLSADKTNAALPAIADMEHLINQVEEEGYELSEKVQGETTIMSLSNPHHVSCKTYSVSFNSKSLQPEKMFCRMSNFQNPENDRLDNLLEITFKKIDKHSQLAQYPVQKFVHKEKENWVLNAAYKEYELINML